MPPGCYLEVAKIVKDYFAEHGVKSNAGLDVPVVAVGKLGYPDLAERALREGMCDMVMLARPLLADPEWPNKAYAGRVSEIIPCIGDQEGCLNEFLEGGHPQCAVNPRTGFEELLAETPPRAEKPKRIAVVGAGPAGVVCATTAARRGHRVTLYDRSDKAGGTLIPGCVPKIKYDVANYVDYLNAAVERHARDCDLTVRFRTDVSPEDLRAGGFDAVVVCAGAKPCGLPVPGADLPHVVQAVDVLRNPALAEGKGKIVIVGGGSVGCETAYFLAYELGKDVTVVEMLPYFMKGVCTANRGHLIHHLERKGVRLLNCATVQRIGEREVVIARNVSPTVPDPYVTWRPILPENVPNPLARPIREEWREETLAADLVVLAVGMKPDESLYEACVRERVAAEVHNLGDSFSVGRVFEAVKAGYRVGLAL
jgi:2-enoate reductase